jgi:molybdopterin synthase catalytic subunit
VSHRIGPEPLDASAPLREVEGPDCGAVVSFTGVVRGTNRGKQVVSLDYEAYPEMALKVFGQIERDAAARWPGTRVAIHHRTGLCTPGVTSVVIAAASPHRADAFEACRMAIEQLKADAPIWKHEKYPDGSEWVGMGS